MTQVQKIIKYAALALAFFIIFSIVTGIMQFLLSFTNVFKNDTLMEKLEELKITESASVLDIDVSTVNIIIKVSDTLKAETNNKYILLEQSDNKLFIKEKKHNWFFKNSSSDLVIYVPSDFMFDGVSIQTGAGTVDIDTIATKNLKLNLGAGKVQIDNLYVTETASIDGGAGKISILNGELHNAKIDMGVGELSLTSKLMGSNEIDAGVGKIDLKLIGNDYQIKIEKGIGLATINGEKVKDNTYYGDGSNHINIDGGIGNISVTCNTNE